MNMKKFNIITKDEELVIMGYNNEDLFLRQPFNPYTQESFKSISECKNFIRGSYSFVEDVDIEGEDFINIMEKEIREEPIVEEINE